MYRKTLCAVALAVAWSAAGPARAQDAELSKIRDEIRQLREAYEQRIQALEKRLQESEAQAGSSRPAGESALNPAVSVILNGTYGNLKRDPERYRISGFVPPRGEIGPPKRGPSLGESELTLSANVDHLFRGNLIAAIAPEGGIEIEEAYVQTLGLSHGFTVKAGRFLSGAGYLNEIHAHAWDFTDAPLVSKAFLGNQLAEDGLQVKWVAPTELYADLGAELGRGSGKNGFGSGNLFAHLGGDIGDSTAWRVGVSHLRSSPRDRTYDDVDSLGTPVTNSFSGRSRLWAMDGVLKWSPNGNSSDRNLKLQGEYFRRNETGSLAQGAQSDGYRSRQSGWYAQSVYQFAPQWRVGYRYDRLNSGTTRIGLVESGALSAADFPVLGAYNPSRKTVMVDWSPTEFSRLRLQFARDYSRMGEPDKQIFLQYVMSLGAHGAHSF